MESSLLISLTKHFLNLLVFFLSKVMYMYYLLSFKLLRRKQGGHNVSQHTTRLDTEFIGFGEFLRCLPEDKRIAV